MSVEYRINHAISAAQFIELLANSSLGARRPIDDTVCISGMLDNADLLVTAWHKARLVGAARSITDFHYACYLSDLVVREAYQGQGIGRQLQQVTREQLNPKCKVILLAAPAAQEYYPRLGYQAHHGCWLLQPEQPLC